MSATTIHLSSGWVLAWELLATGYLLVWLAGRVIDARKRYWQKELSKTIARRTAQGLPVKVFVDEGPPPPNWTTQKGASGESEAGEV